MVSITCTNCKAVLTIDDAFVGGVCRCQYCGTIQTVPRSPRPSAPQPAGAPEAQALYHNMPRARAAAPSGTGLDELADAVASSGLASSGLASSGLAGSGLADQPPQSSPPQEDPAQPPPPATRKLIPILLIGACAAAILLGMLLAMIFWHGGVSPAASATAGPDGTPDIIQGPAFCGIPVRGASVIFILDRGNSIADLFDALKAACYRTLKHLGPDRKFQVILWDNDAGSAEFAPGILRNATAGAVEDCQRDFQDLTASGSSHLSGPLREALGRHPQAIVIATSKSDLDDDDIAALKSAFGAGIRIDAVQIATTSPNPALQQAAKATGGQWKLVSAAELREFSR